MTARRSLPTALLLALLSAAIVLGSISIAFWEAGYSTGRDSSGATRPALFPGPPVLTLVGGIVPGAPGTQVGLIEPPTPTPACVHPAGWIGIRVQPDDTLRSLAERYGVTEAELRAGNCLSVSTLPPGAEIYVPPVPKASPTARPTRAAPTPTLRRATVAACVRPFGWIDYWVGFGDSFTNLAFRVGTTAGALMAANCRSTPFLRGGEIIWLPYYPVVYATPTPHLPLPPWPPIPPIPPGWTPVGPPVTSIPPGWTPVSPPPVVSPPPIVSPPPVDPPPVDPPPVDPPPVDPPPVDPPPVDPPPIVSPPPVDPPPVDPPPVDPPPVDPPPVDPPPVPYP